MIYCTSTILNENIVKRKYSGFGAHGVIYDANL